MRKGKNGKMRPLTAKILLGLRSFFIVVNKLKLDVEFKITIPIKLWLKQKQVRRELTKEEIGEIYFSGNNKMSVEEAHFFKACGPIEKLTVGNFNKYPWLFGLMQYYFNCHEVDMTQIKRYHRVMRSPAYLNNIFYCEYVYGDSRRVKWLMNHQSTIELMTNPEQEGTLAKEAKA